MTSQKEAQQPPLNLTAREAQQLPLGLMARVVQKPPTPWAIYGGACPHFESFSIYESYSLLL